MQIFSLKKTTKQTADIFDVECTFNDGHLCGWRNAPDADFNWEVKSGPSDQINAGPTDGHTGKKVDKLNKF